MAHKVAGHDAHQVEHVLHAMDRCHVTDRGAGVIDGADQSNSSSVSTTATSTGAAFSGRSQD
jgi:hypothetical protein